MLDGLAILDRLVPCDEDQVPAVVRDEAGELLPLLADRFQAGVSPVVGLARLPDDLINGPAGDYSGVVQGGRAFPVECEDDGENQGGQKEEPGKYHKEPDAKGLTCCL